jgi:hypothetical protein
VEFIWNLLTQQGVSSDMLAEIQRSFLIVLMLPVVITIVGIARYIIGLRTLNIYVTIIITFVFLQLGYRFNDFSFLRGLIYGLVLLITTFVSSTLLYTLLEKFRMHYIPKLSLIVTGVTMATIVILFVTSILDRDALILVSPFALVMMIIISEGFMSILAKKNFRYTLYVSLETLAISLLSYIIISWDKLQTFVFNYPYVIILLIFVNIYVGRFLGLRLTEYWRFRSLIFQNTIENAKPESNKTK